MMKITIDGPVGAGKSTISDAVAEALGILHLDTGAMYRAVGLTCLERGIDMEDEAAVTALAEGLRLDVRHTKNSIRVHQRRTHCYNQSNATYFFEILSHDITPFSFSPLGDYHLETFPNNR